MEMDKTICYCFKVKAQDIKDAIDNGAKSVEEVQAATNAGKGCGRCKGNVEAVVAELLAK